jgi:DinB superfamily
MPMNVLEHVLLAKPPFAKPANIMNGIPLELTTVRPSGFSHSFYEELWHLNYWLHFSLALIRGENPSVPEHSSGSFPADNETLSESTWQALLEQVNAGLEMASTLARDESELNRAFSPERTVEGELIIVASHNAYHFGRMVALRQILGIWSSDLGESW